MVHTCDMSAVAQWYMKSALLETAWPRVRASPASLRCVIEPETLTLAKYWKTRPYITEKLLMRRKESNQTKQTLVTYLDAVNILIKEIRAI